VGKDVEKKHSGMQKKTAEKRAARIVQKPHPTKSGAKKVAN